jgi:hypothetical protein
MRARYNWRQGPVPGQGPVVEKYCYIGLTGKKLSYFFIQIKVCHLSFTVRLFYNQYKTLCCKEQCLVCHIACNVTLKFIRCEEWWKMMPFHLLHPPIHFKLHTSVYPLSDFVHKICHWSHLSCVRMERVNYNSLIHWEDDGHSSGKNITCLLLNQKVHYELCSSFLCDFLHPPATSSLN